jgi:hypothetical protein
VIVFILLAAVGLVLSALAHFSTFFGVDVLEICPWIWFLHIGIFVVFIPAVVLQKSVAKQRDRKRSSSFSDIAPLAPKWLAKLTTVLFIYTFINFAIFFVTTAKAGSPEPDGKGGYRLASHGKLIRPITANEYHLYRGREVRGMSGHWMLFYCAALMTIVSAYRERKPTPGVTIIPKTLGPKPALTELNYGQQLPRWAPPIWLHASATIAAMMVGWMAGPLLMVLLVFRYLPHSKALVCPMIGLFFGSALAGAIIPATLIRALIPARCPSCGGRAFHIASRPERYRCRDCHREHLASPSSEA